MRTKDELFRIAQRQIAACRQQAVTRAAAAHGDALRLHPELAAAEAEKTRCGTQYVLASARHGAESAKALAAKEAFDAAGAALEAAHRAAGYAPDAFEPAYRCAVCRDTGVHNGRPCACVQRLTRTLRREEINAASPLALCGFETFEIDRYPDAVDPELGGSVRAYMARVLDYAQKYAVNFSGTSRNLIFTGTAGLGKTHLALAIADTVLERGYDVLYTSAAALAAQLSKEHFDRDTDETWLDACKEADLLILDDLGTEFLTQFTLSVLYELINTRMLCHRPTIYTTNIIDQQIFDTRYTEKVASRMQGNCKQVKFFGTDQRRK